MDHAASDPLVPHRSERPDTAAEALTFGVAGHVDHGKTSLVRCLTGVETDRLAEEQRRGISIELGFAPLQLDDSDGASARVGLVDMPGHERFVRRMIAGAAGIDAVLLVVAADEGVMPQAREHLAICQLLGVRRGAVVVTKVDLVADDPALLELLELDLAELVAGTFLDGAPVLRFSARDAELHAPALRRGLAALAAAVLHDRNQDDLRRRPFRMPVDRVFTLHGRGTIATGTAAAGVITVGATLQAAPGDDAFRVRGIERHGAAVAAFAAPGRVALNLAGAGVDDLPAGTVLTAGDGVEVSDRIDAWVVVLPTAPRPLARRDRLTLHLGTARVDAAVVPLGAASLAPGEAGPVQLHTDVRVAVTSGEHLVLRGSHDDPRHGRTVAGGVVLVASAPRRRLADAEAPLLLATLASGDDDAAIVARVALAGSEGLDAAALARQSPLSPARLERALGRLSGRGRLRKLGTPPRWWTPAALAAIEADVLAAVAAAHAAAPERDGVEVIAVARALPAIAAAAVEAVVDHLLRRAELRPAKLGVATPAFTPRRAAARAEVAAAVERALAAARFAPPDAAGLLHELAVPGVDANELGLCLAAGLAAGGLVRVNQELVLRRADYDAMVAEVMCAFADRDGFSTAELKDLLGVTRKHLIPLAELLDARRITVRDPSGQRRIRAKVLAAWQAGDSIEG